MFKRILPAGEARRDYPTDDIEMLADDLAIGRNTAATREFLQPQRLPTELEIMAMGDPLSQDVLMTLKHEKTKDLKRVEREAWLKRFALHGRDEDQDKRAHALVDKHEALRSRSQRTGKARDKNTTRNKPLFAQSSDYEPSDEAQLEANIAAPEPIGFQITEDGRVAILTYDEEGIPQLTEFDLVMQLDTNGELIVSIPTSIYGECNPSNPLACTQYSYLALHIAFEATKGRPPTMGEVLAMTYHGELGEFGQNQFALEALGRNFFTEHPSANDYTHGNMVNWLVDLQFWRDETTVSDGIAQTNITDILGTDINANPTSTTGYLGHDAFVMQLFEEENSAWRSGQGPDVPSVWGTMNITPGSGNTPLPANSYYAVIESQAGDCTYVTYIVNTLNRFAVSHC